MASARFFSSISENGFDGFKYVDLGGFSVPSYFLNSVSQTYLILRSYGSIEPFSFESSFKLSFDKGLISFFSFLDGLMLINNFFPKITSQAYFQGSYNVEYLTRLNDGAYHIFFDTSGDFTLLTPLQRELSYIPFSSVNDALIYIVSNNFDTERLHGIRIIRITGEDPYYRPSTMYYHQFTWEDAFYSYGFLCYGDCCYPNFAPIVQSLGGTPVTDQPQNLKIICQLLGIDINTTLSNCDAMKEYLKRIVTVLGGSSSSEPNENLKSICYLLGVDSNENGLTDCALSKDYVKRNGIMLGAENA